MASTILYKFQSGTTFEALPLPGSAARLFDVKKAIVKAKKLDNSGSMEFDLAIRNADTNEEYGNEGMLLPRGTRLIVQRLPAPRGQGFLARMARNEQLGAPMAGHGHHPIAPGSTSSGFYTIDSRTRDDDEFVTTGGPADDEMELAALQAATNMQTSGPAMTGGYSGGPIRGSGPGRGSGGGGGGPPRVPHFRPNADPELREQEKHAMPKKRATGIPRTFLNLNAPPQTDGRDGDEANVPLLQPNAIGFKELVNRGGGQSENTSGTRRDLDYALKLTSTTIPDHLKCAICESVATDAMLLPWDTEGRAVRAQCIRDALAQNGFRCPLTGIDGVSPDDLIPNVGLRKAAELFIKGVMDKVDEIEQQQVEEAAVTEDTTKSAEANVLDGDGVEKGVLVSKKTTFSGRKREDDPFGGGDDDFGGDVFAVEAEKSKEEEMANTVMKSETMEDDGKAGIKVESENSPIKELDRSNDKDSAVNEESKQSDDTEQQDVRLTTDSVATGDNKPAVPAEAPKVAAAAAAAAPKPNRRDRRRRGPPVGYTAGPARTTGARVVDIPPRGEDGPPPPPPPPHGGRGGGGHNANDTHPPPGSGRGGAFRGGGFRGGGGGGVGGGHHEGRGGGGGGPFRGRDHHDSFDDDSSRGTKRNFEEHTSMDAHNSPRGHPPPPPPFRSEDRGRGGGPPPPPPFGGFDRDDRGGGRGGGGGGRGFRGRGGGGGGGGGFRGGRGGGGPLRGGGGGRGDYGRGRF